MSQISVHRVETLQASLRVPGDKSMSHRAAIFGGLSDGTCTIHNFLPSEDCVNTLNAMRALGAGMDILEELPGFGPVTLRIYGQSMRLKPPQRPIDCGNAGTGIRLLAGLLAGQSFSSELFGDESLSSRPMGRVTVPLGQMGAHIECLGEKEGCAPLRIHPAELSPIRYEMPVASAQVKSAILLAGMFANGTTTVVQPAPSRDHTERMMQSFGIEIEEQGLTVSLTGGQTPQACDFTVPGDISSAAFWLVAAAALPGAKVRILDVGLNPTRNAIIAVLERMGATIHIEQGPQKGEPMGHIQIEGTKLKGTTLLEEEIPNLIDEIPVLAVAAALATGTTKIRNAKELRVKETDRIATVVANLGKMGAKVTEFEDGMEIEGGSPLQGATLESFGDHRIAMAFAIAGLFAEGKTTICHTDCINTSYPGFAHQLDAILHGKSTPEEFSLPTIQPA